jgi:anti-sigma B factor antagonist
MTIKEDKKNNAVILAVEGRLDSTTSAELERKLLARMEGGEKDFLLDFAGMDYISSAGLRVLLMAAKRCQKMAGKVVLSALNVNVREVFDIAGFTGLFTIYDSKEEAVQAF